MESLTLTTAGQIVVFSIAQQSYAILIDEVVEIIRMQHITEVPGTEEHIAGIINLRGKIIPVIHLRKRFDIDIAAYDKKTRIVIVGDEGEHIGLIVDEVKMVTYINEEEVDPGQEMFNYLQKECFKGFVKLEEAIIGILKLDQVLHPHEGSGEVFLNG